MALASSQIRLAATISSVILRLSTYIFLRWILYDKYIIFLTAFTIYAASWYRWDRTLADLESNPQKTIAKQQAHAKENGHATEPPLYVDPRLHDMPPRSSIQGFLLGSLTSSRVFNRANLIVNSLLLLMALDNLMGLHVNPLYMATDLSFVRVGGVDHRSARISARIPDAGGARLIYRPTQPLGAWTVGPLLKATNETDYMTLAVIDGLDASSQYEYRLAKANSMAIHPLFPSSQRFKTFPDPRLHSPSHFTFAASSCIKPGFPYVPLKNKFSIDGAAYLAKEAKERSMAFVLFLGDFIYSDRPYWPGPHLSSFWKRYRQVYASPQWRSVFETVPQMHCADDHEFINDYSGGESTILSRGSRAWKDYNGNANPLPVRSGVNYYSFTHGDTAFFVMDTRSFRSSNSAPDDENKTMLGARQKADFLQWLGTVNSTAVFKFVVSSVPMMRLWERVEQMMPPPDTWSSFLTERSELLDVMQFVPNVIVLSGDKHEFASASLRQTVTEFSTSPLSQFYIPLNSLSEATPDGEDVALRYEFQGSSKFSIFEVDTRTQNEPKVKVDVIIDGQVAWQVTVLGQPVNTKGFSVGRLGSSLADLLGFGRMRRQRWF